MFDGEYSVGVISSVPTLKKPCL